MSAQYVRMSNLILSLISAPALAQRGLSTNGEAPGKPIGRPDALTAQHIDVSLVLQTMLGRSSAADYLARHRVDIDIARRVLNQAGKRRNRIDAALTLPAQG